MKGALPSRTYTVNLHTNEFHPKRRLISLALRYPTNTISYIVLYCNGFIIFFTQIMHKKKNKQKVKKNFFNLTIQYLEKYSWQPTPVFLSGKSHGQRSLVGCSP